MAEIYLIFMAEIKKTPRDILMKTPRDILMIYQ